MMNERIRELMIRAISDVDSIDDPETGRMYIPNCFSEKFAELIVKETLQVARAGIEFGDGMEDAVYKYFGVEE